ARDLGVWCRVPSDAALMHFLAFWRVWDPFAFPAILPDPRGARRETPRGNSVSGARLNFPRYTEGIAPRAGDARIQVRAGYSRHLALERQRDRAGACTETPNACLVRLVVGT